MSKIAWTDKTWNPVVGCTKVSPGCKNCYAERMAHRLAHMGKEGYASVTHKEGGWNGRIYHLFNNRLDKPLHWKKARKIFLCSMGDLFHESVPFEFICKIMTIIGKTRHHTYQILTKRPERVVELCRWILGGTEQISIAPWLPNIWLGVTAENQEMADKRIPTLLQIPAAVRFVSVEPMLGPVNLNETSVGNIIGPCDECGKFKGNCDCCMGIPSLDWVIIGCESGPKRRPCDPDWMIDLVGQCKAAGVASYVKQVNVGGKALGIKDMALWPKELQGIQEFPKERQGE